MDVDLTLLPFLNRLLSRSRLGEAAQDAVLSLPFTRQQIRGSRDLVSIGELVTRVTVVIEGVLASFIQDSRGNRQYTAFHFPGDAANLSTFILPKRINPIQALQASEVVHVSHEDLGDAARAFPSLSEALWRDSAVDASVCAEWLMSAGRRSARSRVAHLLCEIAVREEHSDEQTCTLDSRILQIHIADATGLTAVHVNRVLQTMKDEQLVSYENGKLVLRDIKRLAQAGGFMPGYLCRPDRRVSVSSFTTRSVPKVGGQTWIGLAKTS